MTTSSPHDAFFKRTFSDPKQAASLLKSQLPRSLCDRIDWTTLELVPGSFVDETLADRHTDLLFAARVGSKPVLLYVLLEHQSSVDPWMPYRFLRYILRIWERWRAENPEAKRLPPVIPIVLYHGAEPWDRPTEVLRLIDVDDDLMNELSPHLPRLSFIIDDLADDTDDALGQRALEIWAELTLRVLQRLPYRDDPIRELMLLVPLMQQLVLSESGLQKLGVLLEYIYLVVDTQPADLAKVMHMVGPQAEELMPSLAQRYMQKGHDQGKAAGHKLGKAEGRKLGKAEGRKLGKAEGREQGKTEGRTELLLELMRKRFGHVPRVYRAQLRAATSEDIERWAERFLTAATIEDVFS